MSGVPHVHLVGSVPLGDAERVFRTLGGRLGPHLKRLPDGETGKRTEWIRFIQAMLSTHPDMEVDTATPPLQWRQWDGVLLREIHRVKFKEGVDLAAVSFELGYAADAIASFKTFDKLQREGAIGQDVRFQVSLPTPLAPGYNYVSPRAQRDFVPVFERALKREVDAIAAALPHDRLAVQWDVCQEVLMYEGFYPERPADYKDQILSQLARVGAMVPRDIELGYHLCYGSPKDEHIVQPKDMAIMVEMTNGIFARAKRPVDFVHLPVPRNRMDDGFFAPLRGLALPEDCELILGLVHEGDEAGNRIRLEKARAIKPVAGVGTECGWGRKDPRRVPGLVEAHVATVRNG
jgi:hypothetical protein